MKFLLEHQETDRLTFRKLEHSDFEIWMELFKDEKTTRYLGMSELKMLKNVVKNGLNGLFIVMKMI